MANKNGELLLELEKLSDELEDNGQPVAIILAAGHGTTTGVE